MFSSLGHGLALRITSGESRHLGPVAALGILVDDDGVFVYGLFSRAEGMRAVRIPLQWARRSIADFDSARRASAVIGSLFQDFLERLSCAESGERILADLSSALAGGFTRDLSLRRRAGGSPLCVRLVRWRLGTCWSDNRDMAAVVDAIPLARDAHGVFRVGGTRVTLDMIVRAFNRGASAEEIVQDFPSLELSDVYQVIGYYLRHSAELAEYFARREGEEAELLAAHRSEWQPQGLRARLLARKKVR